MIRNRYGREVVGSYSKKSVIADDGRLRISDFDFSGMDLSGGEIADAILDCCTFSELDASGLTIRNTDFDGGTLSDSDFSDAMFDGVSFYAVEAFGAKFDRSKIRNSEFLGCNLSHASFIETKIQSSRIGVDNMECLTSVLGANFSDAQFDDVRIDGAEYDAQTVLPSQIDLATRRGLKLVEV